MEQSLETQPNNIAALVKALTETSDYVIGRIFGLYERGSFKNVAPECYTEPNPDMSEEDLKWSVSCYYKDFLTGLKLFRATNDHFDLPDDLLCNQDEFVRGFFSGWNLLAG